MDNRSFNSSPPDDSSDASDRRLKIVLGEALGVFDRQILATAIGSMHKAAAADQRAIIQRLLKRIEDPACAMPLTRQPTMRRAKASLSKAT
jgi:hypothetical protein